MLKKELEEELTKADGIILYQLKQIEKLEKENVDIFNSNGVISTTDYNSILRQLECLQIKYDTLTKQYKDLEEINFRLKTDLKLSEKINSSLVEENKELTQHNKRGAGRKPTVTPEQFKKIYLLFGEGKSYGVIAKEVHLSKAYVYKLINKQN